jgi:molybdopterin-binding protein
MGRVLRAHRRRRGFASAITGESAESLELASGDQMTGIIKATEVVVGKE